MKYIITESQRDKLFVMRRLPELKELLHHQFSYYYPCDYDSLVTYMMALKIEMFETLKFDWFDEIDKDIIWDVVTEVFRKDIIENYTTNCNED